MKRQNCTLPERLRIVRPVLEFPLSDVSLLVEQSPFEYARVLPLGIPINRSIFPGLCVDSIDHGHSHHFPVSGDRRQQRRQPIRVHFAEKKTVTFKGSLGKMDLLFKKENWNCKLIFLFE